MSFVGIIDRANKRELRRCKMPNNSDVGSVDVSAGSDSDHYIRYVQVKRSCTHALEDCNENIYPPSLRWYKGVVRRSSKAKKRKKRQEAAADDARESEKLLKRWQLELDGQFN